AGRFRFDAWESGGGDPECEFRSGRRGDRAGRGGVHGSRARVFGDVDEGGNRGGGRGFAGVAAGADGEGSGGFASGFTGNWRERAGAVGGCGAGDDRAGNATRNCGLERTWRGGWRNRGDASWRE